MSQDIDGASVMRTPCLKYSEHDVKGDRKIKAAMKKHHMTQCTNIIHKLYITICISICLVINTCVNVVCVPCVLSTRARHRK